jgi:hypothetical protein
MLNALITKTTFNPNFLTENSFFRGGATTFITYYMTCAVTNQKLELQAESIYLQDSITQASS